MAIVIDLHLKAKDRENYDALYKTLQAILPDTAAYEGAHLISCSADEEAMSFIVHEVWESLEHQQAYLGWRGERGDLDALGAMLGAAPEFIQREHLAFG